jgi:hypothetical protein
LLDSLFTQPNNSIIELEIDVVDDSINNILASDGTGQNYMSLNVGNLFFYTGSGGDFLVGQVTNGKHTIRVRRDATDNYVSIDGGAEDVTSSQPPLEIKEIFGRSGSPVFGDGAVYSIKLDGELINLNEHNGLTFASDDGSITGTRVTSHFGGRNYINTTMIEKA